MSSGEPPLGTPIANGVRWTNFFNGRLLTGDDLRGEQGAGRQVHRQLGAAGGAGVASGLTVQPASSSTAAKPSVQVTAGLAVNRMGKPLVLAADTELSLLAPSSSPPETPPAVGFDDCTPTAPPLTYLAGSGVYVLLIGPAVRSEGAATVNGRVTTDPIRTIGYLADTVQFRLVSAPVADSDLADAEKARNRVAYRFLGTADRRRTAFEGDPLSGAAGSYGMAYDLVDVGGIAPSEVPLAVIYWTTTSGFVFVDEWAVRRRMARPVNEPEWAPVVEDRARVEGEAMLLQFQAQIAQAPATGLGPALSRFEHLPPAGFLPLAAATTPPVTGSPPVGGIGSALTTELAPGGFFDGLNTQGPFFVNGARVDQVIRESFAYPPIDLASGELIWLYEIRENRQSTGATPTLLFTTGHMRYRANAQYDLAHWNYSNYSLRVD